MHRKTQNTTTVAPQNTHVITNNGSPDRRGVGPAPHACDLVRCRDAQLDEMSRPKDESPERRTGELVDLRHPTHHVIASLTMQELGSWQETTRVYCT